MILLTQCNVEVAAKKKKKKRQKTGGRSDNVIINELKKERDVDRYGFARNSA